MNSHFLRSAWGCSVLAILSSYGVEYFLKMEPCPLCLQQRYCMLALMVLLFPIWSPHPFFKMLSSIVATTGLWIAYEHTILQEMPYEQLFPLLRQLPENYENLTPFLTLPFAALLCFGTILICLICSASFGYTTSRACD